MSGNHYTEVTRYVFFFNDTGATEIYTLSLHDALRILSLSANYVLTYIGANLTITTRPITITASAKNKASGEPYPALPFQLPSPALTFSDAFTASLTLDSGVSRGTTSIQPRSVSRHTN